MSTPFLSHIEKHLPLPIVNTEQIGGGDINHALRLDTTDTYYFVKFNTNPISLDMFQKEAKGLAVLAANSTLKIPKVIAVGEVNDSAYLLLEYIKSGQQDAAFWKNFGTQLAEMHRKPQPYFGLDHDNYIGTLPQTNDSQDTWVDFYITQRLAPQLKMAIDQNRMTTQDLKAFEKLYQRLPEICPEEPASLLHGDLWSGNFMSATPNQPSLIDPAISFGHREMDLAMTRLFGGFDMAFYEAYHQTYPIQKGLEDRIEIYQLYYLMAHVNLFGGSYVQSVRKILSPF